MSTRVTRTAIFLTLAFACCRPRYLQAAQNHPARGVVLKVDAAHRSLLVSCEAISGYMEAMEMPFSVHDARELAALKPGTAIRFTIVGEGSKLYAEDVQQGAAQNYESEPMEAGSLSALNSAMKASAAKEISVGEHVPDFSLTDQTGKTIRLSQLQGKVVVLTFGYSRCPNPNYCLRLSNNLSQLERRFHTRNQRDLALLTIDIDPEHDEGSTLAQYANRWKADPAVWHFLTGTVAEVRQVAERFGMNFWQDEGLLTHTLHTVVIDRKDQLAANIEGNNFSPQQLGDLVQSVMNRQN